MKVKNNRMYKKIMSFIVAVAMVIACMPLSNVTVYADSTTTITDEVATNIKNGTIHTLYDVGETALTDDDIVKVNGVECYVLSVDTTNNTAQLITKNIYDQRFNANVANGYDYATSDLKTYMDNFYPNQLGSDSRIIDYDITAYTYTDYSYNLSDYTTSPITQKVYALDAIEAKSNASKFNVSDYDNFRDSSYTNGCRGFWMSAGYKFESYTNAWIIEQGGGTYMYSVNYASVGARPAFTISLSPSTTPDDGNNTTSITWPTVNHPQLVSANTIIAGKQGTKKSPVNVTIKEADNDTGYVTVSYVKGKAKKNTIEKPASVSSCLITVNAGTKYFVDGKYEVASVKTGTETIDSKKKLKSYATVKYGKKSGKSKITLKRSKKNGDQYIITLKKAEGNDTITLVVNNLLFTKADGKRTIDAKKTLSENAALKYVSGKAQSGDHVSAAITWKIGKKTVPMQGETPLKVGKSGKEFAQVYVDDKTGQAVVQSLGNGKKGTVKLTATLNGKTYKTKIKVK